MKLNEFLEPYRLPNDAKSDGLGSYFKFWNNKKIPPNSVLLCGLSDLSGRTKHLNDLRNIFYQLAGFKSNRSLVDLGNIVSLSQDDRSFAFKILLGEVKRSKAILIVLSAEKESIQILLDSQRKNEKSIAFITPCFNDSYQELVQERLVNNVNLLAVQSHFSNTEGTASTVVETFCVASNMSFSNLVASRPDFKVFARCLDVLPFIRKSV